MNNTLHTLKQKVVSLRRPGSSQLTGRTVALLVLLLLLSVGLLGYRLGSLSQLSPIETNAVATNTSLRAIGGAPLNAPYRLLDFIFLHLPIGSLALKARLASMVIALGCSGLFFMIVRRWYGIRNALASTFLFVTSGWLLHSGRFGVGLIMLSFMILAIAAVASWINAPTKDTNHRFVIPVTALACSVALFVPAGLWFVAAMLLILRSKLQEHIKKTDKSLLLASVGLVGITILAIAAALIHHPNQALQWIGIPHVLPHAVEAGKYAAGSIAYLVAHGPYMPELWLAHTPLLDAATGGLLLLGTFFYINHWQSVRVRLLATFAVISVVLIALNGPYALAYIVPLVYLVAATGLVYLLHQWNTVFPRNPIARSLALSLLTVMVLSASIYHVQRYFIAWQSSPDTRQAYRSPRSEIPLNLLQ